MKKSCTIVILLVILFAVVGAMAFKYFAEKPSKKKLDPVEIDIYYDESGFSIDVFEATNTEGNDGYTALRCEGSTLTQDVCDLMAADSLAQIMAVSTRPEMKWQNERQAEVLSLIGKLQNPTVDVNLQGYSVCNGLLDSMSAKTVSFVDCDMNGFSGCKASEFRITMCEGMVWDAIVSSSDFHTIYIDEPKERFPEDIELFGTMDNLELLIFVIHPESSELDRLGRGIRYSAEHKDDIETIIDYLPYDVDDLRTFVDTTKAEIQVLIGASVKSRDE